MGFDWSEETDALYPQPAEFQAPGFRNLVCVTHNASYIFWKVDEPIAEYLRDYITRARNEGENDEDLVGNLTLQLETVKKTKAIFDFKISDISFVEPKETVNVTISASSDSSRTLLSCFSLIKPSTDWFVGIFDTDLCNSTTSANTNSFSGRAASNPDWVDNFNLGRIRGFDAGIYISSKNSYESQGDLDESNPRLPVERLRTVAPVGYGSINVTQLGSEDENSGDSSNSAGAACFPSGEIVTLDSGMQIPIENLRVGQHVHLPSFKRISSSFSSAVFTFSHRDPTIISTVLNITFWTPDNITKQLRVSKGHYIYVHDRDGKYASSISLSPFPTHLVPSSYVKKGDYLVGASGDRLRVIGVEEVPAKGLYNPHTVHGDLIVSDVLVSCFTTAVKPTAASALLSPLRLLHQLQIYTTTNAIASAISHFSASNSWIVRFVQFTLGSHVLS